MRSTSPLDRSDPMATAMANEHGGRYASSRPAPDPAGPAHRPVRAAAASGFVTACQAVGTAARTAGPTRDGPARPGRRRRSSRAGGPGIRRRRPSCGTPGAGRTATRSRPRRTRPPPWPCRTARAASAVPSAARPRPRRGPAVPSGPARRQEQPGPNSTPPATASRSARGRRTGDGRNRGGWHPGGRMRCGPGSRGRSRPPRRTARRRWSRSRARRCRDHERRAARARHLRPGSVP